MAPGSGLPGRRGPGAAESRRRPRTGYGRRAPGRGKIGRRGRGGSGIRADSHRLGFGIRGSAVRYRRARRGRQFAGGGDPAPTRRRVSPNSDLQHTGKSGGGGGGGGGWGEGGGGGGGGGCSRRSHGRAPRLRRCSVRPREAAAAGAIHGSAIHRVRPYHGSPPRARPARRDGGSFVAAPSPGASGDQSVQRGIRRPMNGPNVRSPPASRVDRIMPVG